MANEVKKYRAPNPLMRTIKAKPIITGIAWYKMDLKLYGYKIQFIPGYKY